MIQYRNIRMLTALLLGSLWIAGCQDELNIESEGVVIPEAEEAATVTETVPGMLRINFKRTPPVEKALMLMNTRNQRKPGLMSVDNAIEIIPGARLKRVIPYTKRFEKGDREWGFDMWYRLEFDENISLEEVQKVLAGIPEIESVNPVYAHKMPPVEYEELPLGPVGLSTRVVSMPFNDPMLPSQWNYGKGNVAAVEGSDIGVFKIWQQGIGGDPRVVVAIVDGGVEYSHPDLAANMWKNPGEIPGNGIDDDGNGFVDDVYGANFAANDPSTAKLFFEGHGTHVAGTVAAVNNNGVGVCGVAGGTGKGDGVRLMSCQVSDGRYITNAAAALVYGARNGALIAQCSWGGYVYEADIAKAVEFFTDSAGYYQPNSMMKGGLVICAAGNENVDMRTYPASLEQAIAVTSITAQRKRSSFSNFGTWTTIAAPGGELGSSEFQIPSTWTTPTGYKTEKGTSMACPHVSGVAALVISELGGPEFTNKKLREILLSSVADLSTTDAFYGPKLGAGLIRVDRALRTNDGEAPLSVSDLEIIRGEGDSCRLVWSHVADPNDDAASLYRIYSSSLPIGEEVRPTDLMEEINAENLTVGKRLSYVLPVPADHSAVIYYAVTSVDMWGNESVVTNSLKWSWSSIFIGDNELRVYPLPVMKEVTVEWGASFTGKKEIRIYDLSGRRVYSHKLDTEEQSGKVVLDLHRLSAGNYILELQSEGRIERCNVLKVD